MKDRRLLRSESGRRAQSRKPGGSKNRRLYLEQLEERRVMAVYGSHDLAVVRGTVVAEESFIQPFKLGPGDFDYVGADPSVMLQFTVKPLNNQSLYADPISIRSLVGGTIDVVYSSSSTILTGSSVLVVALKPGNYELAISGDNCSSGEFELIASLVGDVDGDRDVDKIDSDQLRSLLNTSHTSTRYQSSADYNLDGRITGLDNSMLVRNRGTISRRASDLQMSVRSDLLPEIPELPRLNETDPEPRTISRLRSASGQVSDFVDNELYIYTNDSVELEAFVDRWDGTILSSIRPSDFGYADLPNMYLIQIDQGLATGDLEGLLHQLDPTLATGNFEVSSTRGKLLLTAAAQEAQAFASRIGISWIGQPSSSALGLEDPTSRGIADYDPNAATWPHMSSGSPQDIGVVDAWRMMRNDGVFRRLDTALPFEEGRLELAVFDNGFVPNEDWPNWQPFPNPGVPFGLPTPFPGKFWHGTMVINAGAAMPWNNFGAAGPGGPVVNVMAVPTTYDPFITIFGLIAVSAAGADLVNMSFHIPVPALLSWSVIPYDLVTRTVNATGTLIFASAGNEDADIDGETDFIFGAFEDYWYTPPENGGVLAVGGLAYDSSLRDRSSNYGRRDVDLFAPYTVHSGPSAPFDAPSARLVSGTSFSAPFAAGVAALIWAADPSLSADEVEDVLLSNAKRSRDLPGRGNAYIDAAAAVHAVLGDTDPFVCLTGPISGSSYVRYNESIAFSAEADDWESVPTILWTSDRDGEIGTGARITRNDLSLGTHTITVTAIDSIGQSTSERLTVVVRDVPPDIAIVGPTASSFAQGTAVTFVASSTDNNPLRTLPNDAVVWSSDLQGVIGIGHSIVLSNLVIGLHQITVTGVDESGLRDSDTKTIEIVPAIGSVPEINILGYFNGFSITPIDRPLRFYTAEYDAARRQFYLDLSVLVIASDPEDGALTSLRWTSNQTGIYGPTGQVTASPTGGLRLFTTSNTLGATHVLTVTATDSDGQSVSASIVVTVDVLV